MLSRARPAQIENTARGTANMGAATASHMNYSKTLTQHMQNQQASVGGFHANKAKVSGTNINILTS